MLICFRSSQPVFQMTNMEGKNLQKKSYQSYSYWEHCAYTSPILNAALLYIVTN